MCMMFGITANKKYRITKVIEKFFMEFSAKNKDGWGIATYENAYSDPIIHKEAKAAYDSDYARYICENGVFAQTAVAHIRYATAGRMKFNNTHPFLREINGRKFVFAHNGSVNVKNENIKVIGETDSEKIFSIIAEKMEAIKGEKTINREIRSIEKNIISLSKRGKLNILMTDGKYMFVHTNCKNTLFTYQRDGMACFCTASKNDLWTQVPMNKLLVYREGKLIYEGTMHDNEFVKGGVRTNARM